MGKTDFSFKDEKTGIKAKKILLYITTVLQNHNIEYFLEGGTLLGIVRDGRLLEWDHDIDLSVNQGELEKLLRLKWFFAFRGFKFTIRKNPKQKGPFKAGDILVIKIKPIIDYLLQIIRMHNTPHYPVCDIFIKYYDNGHYYWHAKNKIMRVKSHYYESHDLVAYGDVKLYAPASHKEYLTEKYGNWAVPVRTWDCAVDEKTIWTPELGAVK